ncbi:MAG: hypothetical protein KGY99_05190 [Phycisphaerae bacterium]|nr:hypothetical protein [Phycisphaerae bacterium]
MCYAFVIHLHQSPTAEPHYDLMLQPPHAGEDAALATWRLACRPEHMALGTSQPAERIADHPPHFLTYEGPLSRAGGDVRIHDCGTYTLDECREQRWRMTLHGRQVHGGFELRRVAARQWRLVRLDDTLTPPDPPE